jgi:hypothetical protein
MPGASRGACPPVATPARSEVRRRGRSVLPIGAGHLHELLLAHVHCLEERAQVRDGTWRPRCGSRCRRPPVLQRDPVIPVRRGPPALAARLALTDAIPDRAGVLLDRVGLVVQSVLLVLLDRVEPVVPAVLLVQRDGPPCRCRGGPALADAIRSRLDAREQLPEGLVPLRNSSICMWRETR